MLILVDNTGGSDVLHALQQTAGFWQRLARLEAPILLWGAPGQRSLANLPAATTWREVRDHARDAGQEQVVWVEGSQIFLDTDVLRAGLREAGSSWDYFTQWEHCRLPVGIGARAFALSQEMIRAWEGSPQQLVAHVQRHPHELRIRYDARRYTTYEHALLDSRYSERNPAAYLSARREAWGSLDGFLEHVRATGAAHFTYQPPPNDGPCDERRMPAAYGFETPACAVFPTYIMFDVTNVCNSKCTHCPHSLPDYHVHHPKKHLDPSVFRAVIDECVGRELQFIRITADGEPLLHPHLVEMVAYASARGVGPVGLTTNGSLMREPIAAKLLDAGLFMVDFSLDAARPETYARIRHGLDFDRVMQNIHDFIALRDRRGAATKVMVSFVVQQKNRDELETFQQRWHDVADKVLIRQLISNINLVDDESTKAPGEPSRWPCPHFFRRVVISCHGAIKACPVDWDDRTIIAAVGEAGVFATWHGDAYWRHRMEHLNNVFSADSACRDCSDWRGSPWQLGYEKVIQTLKA